MRDAGLALTEELAAEDHVTNVVSYWSEGGAPPLRSDGGDRALVIARIPGDDDQVEERSTELGPRYQRDGGVIVVEDADRVTERGADALLKSIEEPAPRTVWILCAPNPDDVVATIRSRCRLLRLQPPSVAAVAELPPTRAGDEPGPRSNETSDMERRPTCRRGFEDLR